MLYVHFILYHCTYTIIQKWSYSKHGFRQIDRNHSDTMQGKREEKSRYRKKKKKKKNIERSHTFLHKKETDVESKQASKQRKKYTESKQKKNQNHHLFRHICWPFDSKGTTLNKKIFSLSFTCSPLHFALLCSAPFRFVRSRKNFALLCQLPYSCCCTCTMCNLCF